MNDASGSTIIKELVGNSHAGPMMSPLGAAQAPQPTAGKVGGAINFVKFPGSGLTGAVVSTTMSAALANVGATDLSIDAWINFPPTSAPARRHYIINKIDAPNKRGYALYIVRPMGASASYLEFQWGDGIAIHTVTSSAPLAPNQWHFVAATFARSGGTANIRLYVNGAQQGAQTTAASGSLANNISLMIGYQPSSVDEPIAIDELEIFNRALSPAQVQSIYNAGSHGKCLFKVINPNPNTNPN